MAKGLRSSVKKSNRTKLRSRVFAPVEDARTQRLHEKLLAIAQQPKPEPSKKSEMEVDSTEGTHRTSMRHLLTALTNSSSVSAAQETSKEDEYPKGTCILTAKLPRSLNEKNTTSSPSTSSTPTQPSTLEPSSSQENKDMRNLYFYMGLCSDIVGFNDDGDLKFAFDPLPQWFSDHGLTATA